MYLRFDFLEDLRAFSNGLCAFAGLRAILRSEGFEQIELAFLVRRVEVAQVREQRVARFLPAKPVERAVRQDALKQHR